jgi:hypothetical protein
MRKKCNAATNNTRKIIFFDNSYDRGSKINKTAPERREFMTTRSKYFNDRFVKHKRNISRLKDEMLVAEVTRRCVFRYLFSPLIF